MTIEISRGDLMILSNACIALANVVRTDAELCEGQQRDNMIAMSQRWKRVSDRIKDVANSYPMYDRKEVLIIDDGT